MGFQIESRGFGAMLEIRACCGMSAMRDFSRQNLFLPFYVDVEAVRGAVGIVWKWLEALENGSCSQLPRNVS